MIRRLFGGKDKGKGRETGPVDYEEAKEQARDETVESRRALGA